MHDSSLFPPYLLKPTIKASCLSWAATPAHQCSCRRGCVEKTGGKKKYVSRLLGLLRLSHSRCQSECNAGSFITGVAAPMWWNCGYGRRKEKAAGVWLEDGGVARTGHFPHLFSLYSMCLSSADLQDGVVRGAKRRVESGRGENRRKARSRIVRLSLLSNYRTIRPRTSSRSSKSTCGKGLIRYLTWKVR